MFLAGFFVLLLVTDFAVSAIVLAPNFNLMQCAAEIVV